MFTKHCAIVFLLTLEYYASFLCNTNMFIQKNSIYCLFYKGIANSLKLEWLHKGVNKVSVNKFEFFSLVYLILSYGKDSSLQDYKKCECIN